MWCAIDNSGRVFIYTSLTQKHVAPDPFPIRFALKVEGLRHMQFAPTN